MTDSPTNTLTNTQKGGVQRRIGKGEHRVIHINLLVNSNGFCISFSSIRRSVWHKARDTFSASGRYKVGLGMGLHTELGDTGMQLDFLHF
ncbi:hypothetical protein RRG08_041750 [Elysia crispata]|uniref:Uncharacterized protein n=1 Tax=Elysia crispata TaxID=231223 RepID=A0AAE1D747_9GAST|nr:hypothetical protein RRG08_041750 [Elysia crispata]